MLIFNVPIGYSKTVADPWPSSTKVPETATVIDVEVLNLKIEMYHFIFTQIEFSSTVFK